METCIFCEIVAGTAPSFGVYADEHTLAFMDVNPAVDGHVLVIPRKHVADLWDIEDEDAKRVMVTAVRVGEKIRKAFLPDGINIIHATGRAAFQSVFHFHLHLIPRRFGDSIRPPWSMGERSGDVRAIAAMAERIRSV